MEFFSSKIKLVLEPVLDQRICKPLLETTNIFTDLRDFTVFILH